MAILELILEKRLKWVAKSFLSQACKLSVMKVYKQSVLGSSPVSKEELMVCFKSMIFARKKIASIWRLTQRDVLVLRNTMIGGQNKDNYNVPDMCKLVLWWPGNILNIPEDAGHNSKQFPFIKWRGGGNRTQAVNKTLFGKVKVKVRSKKTSSDKYIL